MHEQTEDDLYEGQLLQFPRPALAAITDAAAHWLLASVAPEAHEGVLFDLVKIQSIIDEDPTSERGILLRVGLTVEFGMIMEPVSLSEILSLENPARTQVAAALIGVGLTLPIG